MIRQACAVWPAIPGQEISLQWTLSNINTRKDGYASCKVVCHRERCVEFTPERWSLPAFEPLGYHCNALIHCPLLLLMISTVVCHSNTCFVSSICKEELGDGLGELAERKNLSSRTWEVNERIKEPACLLEGASGIPQSSLGPVWCVCSVSQSCRICDATDCSPPSSSVHGILLGEYIII